MRAHEACDGLKDKKTFIATKNGSPLFETDLITVDNQSTYIIIEGSYRLGFREGQSIRLVIDRSTPDGEQTFVPYQRLREVFYLSMAGKHYAKSGTFNSTLDNINLKYRLNFKLTFNTHAEDIEVDLVIP